jgi:excisionase family DNA binding protein
MTEFPEMMSPDLAAKFLSMSRDKVYRYLRQGILPGKKVGHEWLLSKTALIDMTRTNASKAPAAKGGE